MKHLLALLALASLTACAADGMQQGQKYDNYGRPIVTDKPPVHQPVYSTSQTKPAPTVTAQAPAIRQPTEVQRAVASPSAPPLAATASAQPTRNVAAVSTAPAAKTWFLTVMMVKQEHVAGLVSNPTKNDVFLMFFAEYPNQAICMENGSKAYNAQVPPGHAVYIQCHERRESVQGEPQPAQPAAMPRAGG